MTRYVRMIGAWLLVAGWLFGSGFRMMSQEPSLPERVMIPDVPRQRQSYNLSCESRSAVDLAGFWGVSVAEAAFVAALPRSDNPHKGFIGDVMAPIGSMPPIGYGVYAEPVAATLRQHGVNAQARYGLGVQGVRSELSHGRPLVVWATYAMRDYPVLDWQSADGAISTIVRYEHTFIVIGYDAEGFTMIDAYDAKVKQFAYAAFEAAWSKLGQMAVVAYGPLVMVGDEVAAAARCDPKRANEAMCPR